MPAKFPLDTETFIYQVADYLREHGKASEVAIVRYAKASVLNVGSDFGCENWGLLLELNMRFFSSVEQHREASESGILEAGQTVLRAHKEDWLSDVTIAPLPEKNDRWRQDIDEYLSGRKITNQGRVRSNNPAPLSADGLFFRSQPEIHLYFALKSAGVTFAPLPVFIRGGVDYSRLEPDFVLLNDGVLLVVEVDGNHREGPADAHARLRPLHSEGAVVERVKAEECDTPEKAKACAVRLKQILKKRIGQRG
ncbi:MAG: hypothetical protein QM820_46980 [Minicystis sp.]